MSRDATCPTCGTVFDPVRARVVRVRGGKVMSFCKEACAAAELIAVVAPETAPAAPVVVPPGAPAAPEAVPEPARPRAMTTGGTPVVARRRPTLRILALVAVIVIGGMAIAVVQAISPSSPSRVAAEPTAAERELAREWEATAQVKRPAAEVAPPPAPKTPREQATALLGELMASPSPRIERAAAIALARTCDEGARTHLATAATTETSELARLVIAYILARCGDAAGRTALLGALKSARRDVKADAARHLIALGDDAGLPFLHALLGVSQHRLGAAEALARRKDPKALAALRAIHGNEATEPDDRLRAAIALGLGGEASVAAELRAALADPRFRPAAAAALAELRDPAAREALVAGLAVPSLRVDAARALRRLDPDLDPAPLLAPLLDALATERDNSQVSAAEALLVLTGPAADAERP